jgi:hypothetical protein
MYTTKQFTSSDHFITSSIIMMTHHQPNLAYDDSRMGKKPTAFTEEVDEVNARKMR